MKRPTARTDPSCANSCAEAGRTPRLALSLILLFLPSASCATAAGEEATTDRPFPTLDEVRSHVEESLGSLVSASVRYRDTPLPEPDSDSPYYWDLKSVESISWDPRIRTWQMDGPKWTVENEALKFSKSGKWNRERQAYDGRRSYQAYYSRENPKQMTSLNIWDEPRVTGLHEFSPGSWLGLHLPWTDETLLSLLARPEVRIEGWETIDRHECLHLDLGKCLTRSDDQIFWEAWLDPQRDWLGRQFRSRRVRDRSKAGRSVIMHQVRIVRFHGVSDGFLDQQRWFPDQIEMREVGRHTYDVLDVSINEAIPSEAFEIKPQIGTQVVEAFPNDPSRSIRRWIHGGAPALATIRQETTRQAQEMLEGGSPVEAMPDAGLDLVMYGWLAGALLAVAAVVVWWRRR